MSGTQSESPLESLPMELQDKMICQYLCHDQLKDVFHVSKRIREAVLRAKQNHFDYKTPRRSDRVSTPPAEHSSLQSMRNGTPPAPRRPPPRSRLNFSDQPLSESLPLYRALSYEDELSQAVARFKL
ncbi:F-box protein At4g35930-like isoform X2 [Alnus glutinosa]|uniref:F-box protein At4g35930-like isoform X2 n=1 Tax=Alnus glutinosa TaxID=3517 RepID=UPI002D799B9D|nr:F-box protein At4g35930-like isoform X2 [Alnus glutinosa]